MDTTEPPTWQSRFPPISYWVKVGALIIGIVTVIRMLTILQGLLVILAASLVLAIGMQPAITWLERRGLSRRSALAVLMTGGLAVMVGASLLIVPLVVTQVTRLVQMLPDYINGLEQDSPLVADLTASLDPLDGVRAAMQGLPDGALGAVGGLFGAVFDLVLVATLTPYFAVALPQVKRWAVRLLVRGDREEFLRMLNQATELMGNYIVGNLLVSVVAGTVTFVGLLIIGVPYAAALATFVALTDMIPAVGATIGAIVVVSVAATEGVGQALAAAGLVLVYQQVENLVIVPRVMRDAIDIKPATGIVALLIGGTLAGPVGALLSLPVAAMLKLVLADFVLSERMRAVRAADAADMAARQNGQRRRRFRTRSLP